MRLLCLLDDAAVAAGVFQNLQRGGVLLQKAGAVGEDRVPSALLSLAPGDDPREASTLAPATAVGAVGAAGAAGAASAAGAVQVCVRSTQRVAFRLGRREARL